MKVEKNLIKLQGLVKNKIISLSKEIKDQKEIDRFINKLIELKNKQLFSEAFNLIEKSKNSMNRIKSYYKKHYKYIEDFSNDLSKKCIEVYENYPNKVKDFCVKQKIDLDNNFSYDKYSFYNGFLTLEIDSKNFTAEFFSRQGILFSKKPFDPDTIFPLMKKEINRIFNRKFNSKLFLKKLFDDYKEFIKNKNKNIGDLVNIKEFMSYLSKKYKNFKYDEFVIDLSKLVFSETEIISGYRLTLNQIKNYDNLGILLYGNEGRGYIGYISFKKER